MAKVKQGKVITVDNKDRKFGANEKYYAIWIEDSKKWKYTSILLAEYPRVRRRGTKINSQVWCQTIGTCRLYEAVK